MIGFFCAVYWLFGTFVVGRLLLVFFFERWVIFGAGIFFSKIPTPIPTLPLLRGKNVSELWEQRFS